MDQWYGRTAVVTGASSGIGAAICSHLAVLGMLCVGVSRQPQKCEALNSRLEHLDNIQGSICGRYCDVRDADSVQSAFDSIKKEFGSIDVVINAAGIVRGDPILGESNSTIPNLANIIETNVIGTVHVVRAAYKMMKEQDSYGHIVLINSVAGHGVPNFADKRFLNLYSPSKYAITSMVEVLRQELNMYQNKKIKVSSVSPGLTKTSIFKTGGLINDNLLYDNAEHLQPEDIAEAVAFVLSTKPNVLVQELTVRPVGETM